MSVSDSLGVLLNLVAYWAETIPEYLKVTPDGIGGLTVKDTNTGRTLVELDDFGRPTWVHTSLLRIDVDPKNAERWDTIRCRVWQANVGKVVVSPGELAPVISSDIYEPWEDSA